MPNPTPNTTGLSRNGRKPTGRVRLDTRISPVLKAKLEAIALQQDWPLNYTLEQYLKLSLGMATDYDRDDLELIAQGMPIE